MIADTVKRTCWPALALLCAFAHAMAAPPCQTQPFDVVQITMPSPVQDAQPPNPTIYMEYYQPKSPGKHPAVVLVHHWRMNKPFAEQELARALAEAGIAVAMPLMPYHMQRSPAGYRSGLAMISGDVPRTLRAVTQAAAEIHAVAQWLREQPEVDTGRIGIAGISLGAIVSAIAVGQRDEFDAIALILGGGDVADVLWTSPSTWMVRKPLNDQGYTEEILRQELAPIEPLNCLKAEQGKKVLMVNATYDFVIPKRDTDALWDRLGCPRIVWVESGHYITSRARKRIYAVTRDFMLNQFGEMPSFKAPSRITLRRIKLGMQISNAPVIGIGGAVELVRLGRTPLAVDLNGTSAGVSAGAVVNLSNYFTVGVQHRFYPKHNGILPYVMVHVLL